MKNVGLFVDIADLYFHLNKAFGKKLDYFKYREKSTSDDDILIRANAYGYQKKREARDFIACLKHIGFDPKFKRPYRNRSTWYVGMTVDIVDLVISGKVNVIVLGSSNPEFAPLVKWIKERGVECVVFAKNVPKELKKHASKVIEIDEELLETTEQSELPSDGVRNNTGDDAAEVV